MIDATQFETALLNLASNARDAMPNGGTIGFPTESVRLSTHEVGALPAGQFIKLRGRYRPRHDAGYRRSAIDPFFTAKAPGKGTGMGLSRYMDWCSRATAILRWKRRSARARRFISTCPRWTYPQTSRASPVLNLTPATTRHWWSVISRTYWTSRSNRSATWGTTSCPRTMARMAIEIMKRTPDIGLLFSDVMMPGIKGIQLGREARDLIPDINILLASG
jgi:hypothetical protein